MAKTPFTLLSEARASYGAVSLARVPEEPEQPDLAERQAEIAAAMEETQRRQEEIQRRQEKLLADLQRLDEAMDRDRADRERDP